LGDVGPATPAMPAITNPAFVPFAALHEPVPANDAELQSSGTFDLEHEWSDVRGPFLHLQKDQPEATAVATARSAGDPMPAVADRAKVSNDRSAIDMKLFQTPEPVIADHPHAASRDGIAESGDPNSPLLSARLNAAGSRIENSDSAVPIPASNAESAIASRSTGKFIASDSKAQRTGSAISSNRHSVDIASVSNPGGLSAVQVPVESKSVSSFTASGQQNSQSVNGQNPFSELDSSTSSDHICWIHAAPRQVEAGFDDPALGWVSVRADLHGGNVHASVMGSSAESSVALGAELAGLGVHLAERHISLDSLTVATAHAQGMNAGDAMRQDSGNRDTREGQPNSVPVVHATQAAPFAAGDKGAGAGGMAVSGPAGTGMHISIRV